MLRTLLIGRVQWDKHAKDIEDLKLKLSKAQEVINVCQEMVKIMEQEKDNLKVLLKMVTLEA